jgi:chromatin structure-remodeling complex protein RSC7
VNGVYDIHTNMMHYPAMMQPTHVRIEQVPPTEEEDAPSDSKHFPPLPPRVPRNFQVMDFHMETPPSGVAPSAYGNTVTADFLTPFRGLNAVSDEIKELLPPECRQAFDGAASREEEWVSSLGKEKSVTCRRLPMVNKAVVPFFPTI